MAQKVYGIDFGTSTIKVYRKGHGIVLNERNAVATAVKNKKTIAIGEEAYEMFEKAPPSIHISFPIVHGVISEIQYMTSLCDYMLAKASGRKRLKGFNFYIAAPCDVTNIERMTYARVLKEGICKPRNVFLIDKPIADAYGIGLDVENSNGILIVNIGADTSEISVLSRGSTVFTKLLPYGGNYFDEQIMNYIKKEHNFVVGKRTAEQLKKTLITAIPMKLGIEAKVLGIDIISGLPSEISINSQEIYPLVSDVFEDIAISIRSLLERTPPEISREIIAKGIFVTGGSSSINGLNQMLTNETYLKVNTPQNSQETVITGIGYLIENSKLASKYAVLF